MHKIDRLFSFAVAAALVLTGCGEQTAPAVVDAVATIDAAAATTDAASTCQASVVDWGPRVIARDQPFNKQSDGSSAFWIRLGADATGFQLRLAQTPIAFDRAGQTLSFISQGALAAAVATSDALRIDLTCGDRVVAGVDIAIHD